MTAAIAQLGERQTEVLKVPCSSHGRGIALIAQRQRAISKRTAFFTCFIQMLTAQHGSMAERSKAPGLGPGPHLWAWVRTPLLSSQTRIAQLV